MCHVVDHAMPRPEPAPSPTHAAAPATSPSVSRSCEQVAHLRYGCSDVDELDLQCRWAPLPVQQARCEGLLGEQHRGSLRARHEQHERPRECVQRDRTAAPLQGADLQAYGCRSADGPPGISADACWRLWHCCSHLSQGEVRAEADGRSARSMVEQRCGRSLPDFGCGTRQQDAAYSARRYESMHSDRSPLQQAQKGHTQHCRLAGECDTHGAPLQQAPESPTASCIVIHFNIENLRRS